MTGVPPPYPSRPKPFFPVRSGWLDMSAEVPLDPGLPIIDTHHHLGQFAESRYGLGDLTEDVRRGGNIRATIYVECRLGYDSDASPDFAPVGETRTIADLAVANDVADQDGPRLCAAIVCFANLALGARVDDVLRTHIEAGRSRVRGVRQIAAWHADADVRTSLSSPPPGLFLQPLFQEGFARLEPIGLSFDAWVYHSQLDDVVALARRFPATTIIIDHLGGFIGIGRYAADRAASFAEWRSAIACAAQCPNIHIKIGGMGMPLMAFGFDRLERAPSSAELAKAWKPFVETCIELFGPSRCMFESNFPVDKGSYSYVNLWNAFVTLTQAYSPGERNMLFSNTAARVYRL